MLEITHHTVAMKGAVTKKNPCVTLPTALPLSVAEFDKVCAQFKKSQLYAYLRTYIGSEGRWYCLYLLQISMRYSRKRQLYT